MAAGPGVVGARESLSQSDLDLLMRGAQTLLQAATTERAVLDSASSLLAEHFGFGSSGVLLYDPERKDLYVAAVAGRLAQEPEARSFRAPLGNGIVGLAAAERRVINVPDLRADPRAITHVLGVASVLYVPLVVGHELFGILATESTERGAFSQRDETLVAAFGQLVALALTHARAHEGRRQDVETIRAQLSQIEAMNEVAQRATSLDLPATLQTVVDAFQRLTTADSTAIYLWSDEEEMLSLAAMRWEPHLYPDDYEQRARERPLRLGEGIIGWSAQQRTPQLIDDVASDARARPITGIPLESKSAIVVPIITEDHLLGVIRAVKLGMGAFTQDHFRLAKTLASASALAIAATRAHDAQSRRITELAALNEVTQRASKLDLDATLHTAVDALRRLTPADSAGVWLWRPEREVLEPAVLSFDRSLYPADYEAVVRDQPSRMGVGLVGWVALHLEPLLVDDVTKDPRGLPWIGQQLGARSGIFAPLVAEGKLLGVLRGMKFGERSFTHEHLRVATTLANSAALAIAAATAYANLERRVAELARLHQASLSLAEAATLEEALDRLLGGAIEISGGEAGLVWRRQQDGTFALAAGKNIDAAAVGAHPPDAKGSLSTEMLSTGDAIVLGDLHSEVGRPAWKQDVPTLHSLMGVPLLSEGVMYGSMFVLHSDKEHFRQSDVRHLQVLAAQGGSVLARVHAFDETRRLAITDELTHCFNARYFAIRLREEVLRARRYGHAIALIMLDSDSLKIVNDRFGHEAGNRHLVELAKTIKDLVRSTDIVARFGGDEFLILQPETNQLEAALTAERIREEFHERRFASSTGDEIGVSVSAGVASLPQSAIDAEDLFRQADTALYVAKRQGKNCVSEAPLLSVSAP